MKRTKTLGNPRDAIELVSVQSMKTLSKAVNKIYEAVYLMEQSYKEQQNFAGRLKKELKTR